MTDLSAEMKNLVLAIHQSEAGEIPFADIYPAQTREIIGLGYATQEGHVLKLTDAGDSVAHELEEEMNPTPPEPEVEKSRDASHSETDRGEKTPEQRPRDGQKQPEPEQKPAPKRDEPEPKRK